MSKPVDFMAADLGTLANCLRLIGHPNRLAIVFYLLKGPCLVSELESELNLHQPNLSQHLSILRDANILASQRQAKAVLYALNDGPTRDIIAAVYGQLGQGQPAARPSVPAPRKPGAATAVQATGHDAWRQRGAESDDASVFAQVLPPSRG